MNPQSSSNRPISLNGKNPLALWNIYSVTTLDCDACGNGAPRYHYLTISSSRVSAPLRKNSAAAAAAVAAAAATAAAAAELVVVVAAAAAIRNSVKTSKSLPGADCDSDHIPVICKADKT
ncbi:hypothetical protein PoB_004371200 [Plakobranchus ocellatus]|uniref:Uncharacterized protein n=1 Tax=Plakobranchus ocellatus TaxID=259542 RepID=A0AAV4BE35_9GAST|nr:hypothetical protein PoB_004371200 [Plakobranchus ocellatus]